jgi:hypothetical protein
VPKKNKRFNQLRQFFFDLSKPIVEDQEYDQIKYEIFFF